MGKTAGRPAAEDQPNQRPAKFALKRFRSDVGDSHFVPLNFSRVPSAA
jgi:hypothetical protein